MPTVTVSLPWGETYKPGQHYTLEGKSESVKVTLLRFLYTDSDSLVEIWEAKLG
jgi:hypothetical protein